MKFLIIGLGNIGTEYELTRHNIGFDIADVLVMKHEGKFSTDRLASVAKIKIKGKITVVIKPTTYMNLSGRSVKYWMDKEKIEVENILVLCDDLALPLETLRLKKGGSHAGHNGLKSIDAEIGTNQYPRLRFGIGNDFPKGRQVEFVLGKWKNSELPTVKDKLLRSVDVIESFVQTGIEQTMNEFNNTK